ncbi:MAG: fibronectin type III domain-containing protein [Bacteroidia bacterium]|nr:fibronectin type III domain-containing protein [Bacteroidia bacterium]
MKRLSWSFSRQYRLLFILAFLLSIGNPTFGQCPIPTAITTSNITNQGARFNWTSPVVDSFLVRYYESGVPVYIYKTVPAGNVTNLTIFGLHPNTTYYWQVRTTCNGGISGGYQAVPAVFTTSTTVASCIAPNKTATAGITSNTAIVSWNPLVSADTFMVRYAVRNTTNYVWIKVHGSQKFVTLTGLTPNTQYDWWVRSICGTSVQGYSILNRFTTLSSTCGTADVGFFSASGISATTATVGWRGVGGAMSYNVRYAVRYSGNWTTVASTSVSKQLTNLQPLTWYEFQVQTNCATGSGTWSTSGIFQTLTGAIALTRGPYLQLSTPTSIVIRWRSNVASDSRVKFGTSVSNLNFTTSSTTQKTEHEVQLVGLSPNTKYYYSIGSSTSTLQGDANNYFITNPVSGSSTPIRVWVIGDFGHGTTGQSQVRDSYVNYTGNTHTNLWLWLGDNAYDDGTDSEYQSKVFNVYPNQFKKWVTWPTSGNHDLHSANASNQTGPYFDNFTMPKLGEAGGLPSNTEAYYSFNYANVHFVCLESNDAAFRSTSGAMANWLRNDLAANTQRWTVVYFHHPPYSKGSHDSDNSSELVGMRTNIIPILETYKVDLVLSGHSHSYERSMMIRGHYGLETSFNASTMAVSSGSGISPASYIKAGPNYFGTVYAVCGTSGVKGGTTSGWPHNAMYASSVSYFGSMVIDVNGDRLDAKYLTSTGTIWDQFTIQKQASLSARKAGDTGLNIAVPAASSLLVFPNPVTDDATISYNLEKASSVKIDVMDVSGRVVYSMNNDIEQSEGENTMHFPVQEANLPKGIYLIRLYTNADMQSSRFVVE